MSISFKYYREMASYYKGAKKDRTVGLWWFSLVGGIIGDSLALLIISYFVWLMFT